MTIEYIIEQKRDDDVISLEQYRKKRVRRRKRVSKRMIKRFPLFAAEFMREEFSDITQEQIEEDVKNKKLTRYKGKSQIKRQGRFPMLQKALSNFLLTRDQKYLEEAQKIRNNLFKRFIIEYRHEGLIKRFEYPSTMSVATIKELASIKFETWAELEEKKREILKYAHVS